MKAGFIAGLALVASASLAIGFAAPAPIVRNFDLVAVSASGDLWVLDHGITRDDCAGELASLPIDVPGQCRFAWR